MSSATPSAITIGKSVLRPKSSDVVTALFIGDIVGRPGRKALAEIIPLWNKNYSPDIVIANIENAAGGSGITNDVMRELSGMSIDVFTSGNHIWQKRDALKILDSYDNVLRPANYPRRNPGKGWCVYKGRRGHLIGVINVSGRVFMDPHQVVDSPFDSAEVLLVKIGLETHITIVDIHAEATSEKKALGFYLNGRVTAVIGTHTHVQTADESILSGGTAFITDAGMTGPIDSIIGMSKKAVIEKFLTGMPRRFEVARSGKVCINGVLVKAYASNGRAFHIERLQEVWQ